MGSIKIGDREPSLLRLGDAGIYEAYAGSERIWPGSESKLWLHLTSKLRHNLYHRFSSSIQIDFIIDWGDGQSEHIETNHCTHTYAGPGDYLLRFRPAENILADMGYGLMGGNILGISAGSGKTGTSPELTRMEIGGYVSRLVGYVFAGCTSLRTATIPGSVMETETQILYGCTGLVLAEIGAHRLGTNIVKNCPSLQKLWLRESVESIGTETLLDIGPTGALTIYCEADEKPAGWDAGWNPGNFPVVWGQKVRPW